jgi:hypothetical protein
MCGDAFEKRKPEKKEPGKGGAEGEEVEQIQED